MSVRIGEMNRSDGKILSYVHASLGGVELTSDERFTLEPVAARNGAAVLVRAADEVERMRRRTMPEESVAKYDTDFAVDPDKYPALTAAIQLKNSGFDSELLALLRDARSDAVQYVKDVREDELRRAFERGKAEGK
jgi:hypothetical protein